MILCYVTVLWVSLFLAVIVFCWCSKSYWCLSASQPSLLSAVKCNVNSVKSHESAKLVVKSCCGGIADGSDGKGVK